MNRIGFLTIHNTINFGSQLQTYSLYKAVQSLGLDLKLIDYRCEAIEERESTLPLKEAKGVKGILKSLLLHKNLQERKDNFQKFLRDNMNVTRPYYRKDISQVNAEFDTFLVGSDIVWGLNITGNDYTYMMDFAEDEKRKLAFSSSVGTKWEPNQEAKVAECLGRFNDIAVREEEAAKWIGDLLSRNVDVTCDPTMLWDRKFWDKIADKAPVKSEKYVLVYMSDPGNNCVRQAKAYAKARNMPVYYINYRAPFFGTVDKRPTSLEQWLSLFKNAETVFSASYHGLLFALYFQKQVFYFNWVNQSRMNSLTQYLGIEHREGTPENITADEPVNFETVNQRMEEKRQYSWNRLRSMLDV